MKKLIKRIARHLHAIFRPHLPKERLIVPKKFDAPVQQIMTTTVQTCEPGQDVDSLMAQMTEHRIRHVPVCDGDRLVGVVSIGDVVKSRITELEFERDQLDHYVHQT